MGNSARKRRLHEIETGSFSSPLNKYSKRHSSQPDSNRHEHPAQPLQLSEDDQNQRSSAPSPSSFEVRHQTSSEKRHQPQHQRHSTMPPPNHVGRKETAYSTTSSSRIKPHDYRQGKQNFRPTLISPPVDPRSEYLSAVRAQNRDRGRDHQTFTAQIPFESESEADAKASIQETVDDNETESGSASDMESDEKASTSSLDSSSVSNETSDSELHDDRPTNEQNESSIGAPARSFYKKRRANNRRRKALKREKENTYKVQQVAIGKDAVNELQRKEKARMEKAAERAISSLYPSTSSKPTTTTLTQHDQAALKSIKALIPQHFLTGAHQPHPTPVPSADPSKSKSSSPSKPKHPTPQLQSNIPSDLTTTLYAARCLIMTLSATRLAKNNDTIQAEMIRITRDQEKRIETLEDEVAGLRKELERKLRKA